MSKEKTYISELSTAIGCSGENSLDPFLNLGSPPDLLKGVSASDWEFLKDLYRSGQFSDEFEDAFSHGRYFFESNLGLRRRIPLLIEWRGPRKSPEIDPLPSDLRIDHVFTISCKNLSKVLRNPSPSSLFLSALENDSTRGNDWYSEVAPNEYSALLQASLRHLEIDEFPYEPNLLNQSQRQVLKTSLRGGWPNEIRTVVDEFNAAVSNRSADHLKDLLTTRNLKERFFWRLMRMHSSPYYVLGTQPSGPMRLRVLTPWDFQMRYKFLDLIIRPEFVGQPQVSWTVVVSDLESDQEITTEGHFEIRWSHGKFCGAPEAKVYLDTPHIAAAGYQSI